jgi:hypothetical protein
MKVERFHRNADDAQIRHLLFGDLPISPQQPADQSRVEVRDPQLDGEYLLQRFATRAFRRPVEAAQLHRFVEIFSDTLNSQNSFVAALRAGYRAILCSARFMYFYEPPGELDDYSIASRLSYLLWNSLPDEQLLQLAAEGKLREPRVIAAQVDRMLASSQGQNFVRDFASEWLELRDIGFTEPDPKLYPEFDMIVQASMLAETQAFLQHMLEADRPVHELIASQTTFLNNRLADFYGIAGVHGDGLQRVELPSDSVRGGLLSQGAILKVTANGTHTSPVLRGVWISERLLGCPIPPPPEGVPAIEPDIRGATTIREQLDKHRQDSACATCHTKIDPPGFALENFDAAGGWRDVYPRAPKGQGHPASPVDASYVFADGRPFANFQEFRKLSARDPLPLARNFATHVLTYGTGGKPEFADRPAVEQIVTQTAEQAYGLRSILKAVTSSRLFLDN